MKIGKFGCLVFLVFLIAVLVAGARDVQASPPHSAEADAFPRALDSYHDEDAGGIWQIVVNRVREEPFNLVATLIFLLAIVHTFLTSKFTAISHKREHEHELKIARGTCSFLP